MSYNKCHTDIGYENEPSVETPLNETNLNYTDHCVDILDDRVVALDVAKLAVSEANSFITNITMNDATGIFTITKRDGTSYTIDTKLEKIAVNFRYDSATQKLIITLSDGTTQEVDLSSLITENEFTDSSTIAFTVVNHNVSATVKAGSITDSMLESGFLAAAQAAKSGAELAKSGADASALKAEGFAVGQQGGIDVPSTSPYHDNNAKFYAEQAETSATNAANSEDNASDYASAASTSATNASNSASAASTSAGNASTSATNASNSADAAADSATEASEYATSASGSANTATSKASEAGGYATSANDSRLESEGYAVGTQDGVEVPSTSPYYHNNAKYYRDQAGSIVGGHNVSYDPNQGLSETEMANARANIGAVSTSDFGTLQSTVSGHTTAINNKVDKVTGKGLSSNDYTTAEQTKLAGIEAQANKTIVDSALSASSTNPVQNKIVNDAITNLNNNLNSVSGVANEAHSVIATEFSSSKTYSFGNLAFHDGKLYEYTNSTASSGAWNPNYWTEVKLGNMAFLRYTVVSTF